MTVAKVMEALGLKLLPPVPVIRPAWAASSAYWAYQALEGTSEKEPGVGSGSDWLLFPTG